MDRYTVVRTLGKGNFGTVSVVRCNDSQHTYVLKEIDLSKLDANVRKAALNEAQLLATMKHHGIVGYKESILQNDQLLIVMEWCSGGGSQ